MKKFLLGIILFLSVAPQVTARDSLEVIPVISATYAPMSPMADMASRFGFCNTIGAAFSVKLKSNWIFMLDGHYLFGSDVKQDDILTHLEDPEDEKIINKYGEYTPYAFYMRGMNFNLRFGKIIPITQSHPNSGILLMLGGGFLEHFIRIEHEANRIPALDRDYVKGYDRLSNGFDATAFVGYIHFGHRNTLNFFAGIEFHQGFTYSRRKVNFDTRTPDTGMRLDQLLGIRVGWNIPLTSPKIGGDDFYYN